MFSELLLQRNVEGLLQCGGGVISLVDWTESDLIPVSKRKRTEAHSYALQPSQPQKAEVFYLNNFS